MDHLLLGIESEESEEHWKIFNNINQHDQIQFCDAFRHFHPDRKEAFTCWHTLTNCRSNNFGTRIDYILTCKDMQKYLTFCDIQPEIMGSDHCPVKAEFAQELRGLAPVKPPQYCTKNFPEFYGNQQKLSEYFMTKPVKRRLIEEECRSGEMKMSKKRIQQQSSISSFFAKQ